MQAQKAAAFRALHEGEPFVTPNPWDAGSAKVLAALGFKARATTSSGFASTLGRPDGSVTLDELVEHVAALDAATALPVSVDLENGYEAEPGAAAVAIERAAGAGAVGGSIEDYDPGGFIYPLEQATERVAAAVAAARRRPGAAQRRRDPRRLRRGVAAGHRAGPRRPLAGGDRGRRRPPRQRRRRGLRGAAQVENWLGGGAGTP